MSATTSKRKGIDSDDNELDELDNGPDLPRPRFSLPIEEDDDSFQAPPRLSSALNDDTLTQMSIEGPRRAIVDGFRERLSTGLRVSQRFAESGDLDMDLPPGLEVNNEENEIFGSGGLMDEYSYQGYVLRFSYVILHTFDAT